MIARLNLNRIPPTGETDPALAQLLDDLVERLQAGEAVDAEALVRQHPEHAEQIRRFVPALEALVDLGVSSVPGPAHPHEKGLEDRTLGDFRLLREVGRGGMGIVYEARQISLGRRVALKVLPFAAAIDPKQLQRFQVEAQAAAYLHHTNIVPVFAVGCERGVHYYAMQFIEGRTLADVIRELRRINGLEPARPTAGSDQATESYALPSATPGLPASLPAEPPWSGSDSAERYGSSVRTRAYVRTVAGLGVQAAEALEHAHVQGVLHRDIKPSNLLIDDRGNLWVTDFGLARFQEDNGLTMTGDLLGTLRYMSPEQAMGRRVVIDQRSDVYSLGVTLYELLTLEPAFGGRDRVEILRRVAEEEPRPLRKRNPSVPVDLETIVRKAMEKEPASRYATAGALAEDLRRFLDSRPIVARRPSLLDRATKWAVRHRTATASAVVVVMTVLITTAVGALVVASKERQHGQAALAAEHERRLASVAVGALESRLRVQAEEQTEQGRQRQVRLNVEQGIRLMDDEDMAGALRYFVEALRLDHGNPAQVADHRVRLGMLQARCAKPARMWFVEEEITSAVFSRDGRAVAVTMGNGTVRVSVTDSGQPLGPLLKGVLAYYPLAFSPDGRRIAVRGDDATVRVIDVTTGRESFPSLKTLGHRGQRFSPDGTLLLAPDPNHWRVWDARTGQPLTDWIKQDELQGGGGFFSSDSRLLAVQTRHDLQLYEARTGRPVLRPIPHPHQVVLVDDNPCFSPDARRVVSSCLDGFVRVWDTSTGALVTPPMKHPHRVEAAFSPDAGRILTWCWDGTVRLWDAATGTSSGDPMRHPDIVRVALFSPDGKLVATRCDDNAVRVWEVSTSRLLVPPLWHLGALRAHRFSPDGRSLFTASADGTVRRWDLAGARNPGLRLPGEGRIDLAEFSPDGRLVVARGPGGTVRVWDATTGLSSGPPISVAEGSGRAGALSPDGREFAVSSNQTNHRAAAWIWDLDTQRVKAGPLVLESRATAATLPIHRIAWSPDGRCLALAAGSDRFPSLKSTLVRIWEARTGEPLTPVLTYDGEVGTLEFSPDSRSLLTASGGVRIHDAGNGSLRADPIVDLKAYRVARYSPDGHRFLTIRGGRFDSVPGNDVQTWDAATGRALSPPIHHSVVVADALFTRDGARVVTASDAIRVWDAVTGAPAGSPIRFPLTIDHISLAPDGRRLLVTCGGEVYSKGPCFAQVVDLPTGWPLTPPLWRERVVRDARFSPDGRRLATTSEVGGVVLWNLVPDDRPLEDLVRMAEVLSGTRVDASGATIPITTEELRAAYETLLHKDPETFIHRPMN